MLDLKSKLDPVQSLAPAAYTDSTDGTGVDLRGYNSAVVHIDVGLWTDGTHTFQVEDSADDTTFAAVADANLQGAEPVVDGATDDNQLYEIGYLGGKRYLRVAVTCATTTTGAVYSAVIHRGDKEDKS